MRVFSNKFSVFSLLIVVAAVLIGCNPKEPIEYSLSDLQGLWKNANGTYMRFTTESADNIRISFGVSQSGYLWGYEWNENDGTVEDDLLQPDMYHGNSWFIYRLEGEKWLQINAMSIGSGMIPETYVITTLNKSTFEYYKEGYKNEKQTYTKQ